LRACGAGVERAAGSCPATGFTARRVVPPGPASPRPRRIDRAAAATPGRRWRCGARARWARKSLFIL